MFRILCPSFSSVRKKITDPGDLPIHGSMRRYSVEELYVWFSLQDNCSFGYSYGTLPFLIFLVIKGRLLNVE
jgi:hypothetical protein